MKIIEGTALESLKPLDDRGNRFEASRDLQAGAAGFSLPPVEPVIYVRFFNGQQSILLRLRLNAG